MLGHVDLPRLREGGVAGQFFSYWTMPPVTDKLRDRGHRRSVEALGTLQAYEQITISPKVEGRIVKIHHEVADPPDGLDSGD